MQIKEATFIKSAEYAADYPKTSGREFAFIGKSNCGKSSLINTIVNRKNLVKTGKKPGMTQLVNFFDINKGEFTIADLPGYGYAEHAKTVRKNLLKIIREYLTNRNCISLVFLLIDSRRKLDDSDFDYINLLAELKILTAITLTKTDKLSKAEIRQKTKDTAETLSIGEDSIFVSSAHSKQGRIEILKTMNDYL